MVLTFFDSGYHHQWCQRRPFLTSLTDRKQVSRVLGGFHQDVGAGLHAAVARSG